MDYSFYGNRHLSHSPIARHFRMTLACYLRKYLREENIAFVLLNRNLNKDNLWALVWVQINADTIVSCCRMCWFSCTSSDDGITMLYNCKFIANSMGKIQTVIAF